MDLFRQSFIEFLHELQKDFPVLTYTNIENVFIIDSGSDTLRIELSRTGLKSNNDFCILEEWWNEKPFIVQGKVKVLLGLSKRIFARKCVVKRIDKQRTKDFLEKNHLKGYAGSKYNYGLFYKNKLVCLATFAAQRNFGNKRSAELVRFCSEAGTVVVGGLDKLLKAYTKDFTPDNIMTYVDREWGTGKSFIHIGFAKISEKKEFNSDKLVKQVN